MPGIGWRLRKLRMLLHRDEFNRELEEEMRFHREQAEREYVKEGVPARDARYAARRQFGNEVRASEQSYRVTGFWFESVLMDLRFALRQLRKNPGFALTAILVLTLGVGASVAIFSFVDAALIRPLPYKDPSRLVALFESIPLGPRFHLSYLDYLDWKRENKVFESLDVYNVNGFMQQTPTGVVPADGGSVSAGFFRTLGVTPILGRDFRPGEDQPSAPRTALLSYGAWQRRYAGRHDAIGQTVILDDHPTTIIGVLPREFQFAPLEPADFFALQRPDGGCEKQRGCHNLFGLARLKPGVSYATAYAAIKTIAQNMERQYPDTNRDQKAFMMTLTDSIVGDVRPILLVLLAGALLLLVIAAVNVTSLLLIRSEHRRREIAVRGALGASRVRLLRQFVTDGVLLAAAAAILGVGAASVVIRLFLRLIPRDMLASRPYLQQIGINAHVVFFAILVALAAAVLFSTMSALRVSLSDLQSGLTQGGRGLSGMVWRRFGSNLVVVELGMTVVLLFGAGLLAKSLYLLLHVDTGLVPDHLATLQMAAIGPAYSKDQQLITLERAIQARLSALPGVTSVGFTSKLPLGDGDTTTGFRILGRPPDTVHREVAYREVSAGYFSTLEARLVSGRYFAEDEDESKPRVAIINQQMAKQYFPGQNPVGMQMALYDTGPSSHTRIVGVVNDIQEGQMDAAPRGALYVPLDQDPNRYFDVILRTSQYEDALLPVATAAIHSVDPGIAVYAPMSMSERLHDSPSASLHRSSAWLVGAFAVLALVLSIVGLYGVVAYSVSQRTREIGVRMALGAQRSAVYRLILREAVGLAMLGICGGLICSVAVTMLMKKLLFEVHAWDTSILASVAFALGAAALLASYLPARRAASVNPTEALHAE